MDSNWECARAAWTRGGSVSSWRNRSHAPRQSVSRSGGGARTWRWRAWSRGDRSSSACDGTRQAWRPRRARPASAAREARGPDAARAGACEAARRRTPGRRRSWPPRAGRRGCAQRRPRPRRPAARGRLPGCLNAAGKHGLSSDKGTNEEVWVWQAPPFSCGRPTVRSAAERAAASSAPHRMEGGLRIGYEGMVAAGAEDSATVRLPSTLDGHGSLVCGGENSLRDY